MTPCPELEACMMPVLTRGQTQLRLYPLLSAHNSADCSGFGQLSHLGQCGIYLRRCGALTLIQHSDTLPELGHSKTSYSIHIANAAVFERLCHYLSRAVPMSLT